MTQYSLAAPGGGGGNLFLIPNATFFVELLIFLIVVGVIWRYVVPPVKRATGNARRWSVGRSRKVSRPPSDWPRPKRVTPRRWPRRASRRRRSGRPRRADAQEIKDEMRQQAEQEVARIRERGAEQLATQREQVVRELRSELGKLAVTLAGRIVGESLLTTPVEPARWTASSTSCRAWPPPEGPRECLSGQGGFSGQRG